MSDTPREPLIPELLPRAGDGTGYGTGHYGAGEPHDATPAAVHARRIRRALILFLLTCATTFYAGGNEFGKEYVRNPLTGRLQTHRSTRKFIETGLIYSLGVLTILGAHEMGHYLQARRWRVPASPPFFLPLPFGPIGTMGAVIIQQAGTADRKSMFDIAITGPLAGLVLALPATYFGLQQSQIFNWADLPHDESTTFIGVPLLVQWMMQAYLGPVAPNHVVEFSPLFFAGWVGIFITALNLIPIGQLDGGHILYCLLRQRAHAVARALFLFAVAVVVISSMEGNHAYTSWTLMLALLWMMGTRHPPTANDRIPLGAFRTVLGWATLCFIFIGFTPTPMYEINLKPVPRPQRPLPFERRPEKEIRVWRPTPVNRTRPYA